MQETAWLIRTKLRPPFTRSELVSRPRLQARIAQGLTGPLTLIVAPAGFGKTTLAASSVASTDLPVAWLSLDGDDNQIERFLNYLVAALQAADQDIGTDAAQLVAAAQLVNPETVLISLINDLDRCASEMVLVLDDYQFIRSQPVHDAVAFLLEYCPRSLHLLVVSRSDPSLSLTRLRARGQMVEIRAADLRFTSSETAQFLNDVMALRLDTAAVDALAERTEGWIAGLHMAALSMRDRDDVSAFIEGFSGTNRYILDYLLEEVLAQQPREIQHFLLTTSILGRLTAPLCDRIIASQELSEEEGRDVSGSSLDAQSMLEYLERANLFLIPLDDQRQWYRYHHLFADLLRSQLQRSLGEARVAAFHLRAAEWYAEQGLTLEAIHHASAAADDETVERLIETHYMEMVNRGEMSWVRSWMGRLSKDLVYRRPWLCLYEALSRSWFGELAEADLLLHKAEEHMQARTAAPDAELMQGYHAYVKSRVTAMRGDTARAIAYCRTAREKIPADNLALQNEASITLGYEYFLYGDFENARTFLYQTIQSGRTARAVNNPVAAYAVLARIQVYQGELREAHKLLQKAALLVQEADGQHLGATALIEAGTAALLYEWNDLEAALGHVQQGLDFLPFWGKGDDFCLAYTTLLRIQLAMGERAEAAKTLEKAAQLGQTSGIFSEARNEVEAAQVTIWLAQGDWLAVDRWSREVERRIDPGAPIRHEDEPLHIARARVLMATTRLEQALSLLSFLEEAARASARRGRLIEILILKSLAMAAVSQTARAQMALEESLALAAPSGYARIFLDEGKPMQQLLSDWLARATSDPLRNYAAGLLSQFDPEPAVTTAQQEKVSMTSAPLPAPAEALVEPLSPRELEVLQLIALGKTNREIAQQLVIAPGTVKAHTSSIFRKLEVANRTEAVARARQLNILN